MSRKERTTENVIRAQERKARNRQLRLAALQAKTTETGKSVGEIIAEGRAEADRIRLHPPITTEPLQRRSWWD